MQALVRFVIMSRFIVQGTLRVPKQLVLERLQPDSNLL